MISLSIPLFWVLTLPTISSRSVPLFSGFWWSYDHGRRQQPQSPQSPKQRPPVQHRIRSHPQPLHPLPRQRRGPAPQPAPGIIHKGNQIRPLRKRYLMWSFWNNYDLCMKKRSNIKRHFLAQRTVLPLVAQQQESGSFFLFYPHWP